MNYNDPRIRGVSRTAGPDLLVSLRESLIEDLRIAQAVAPTTNEPLPELPLEEDLPLGEVSGATVDELPIFKIWKDTSANSSILEDKSDLSQVSPSNVAASAVPQAQPIAVKLLRSLVPGVATLAAIAVLFVLFDSGQSDSSHLGEAWRSANGWFVHAFQKKTTAAPAVINKGNSEIDSQTASREAAVASTALGQEALTKIQNLAGKFDAVTKDFAVTKSQIDQLAVKQQEIVRDIKDIQAAQLALAQKIAAIPPRTREVPADQLASQHDDMARDIAALQATQSALNQKIMALQTRPRVRPKAARPN